MSALVSRRDCVARILGFVGVFFPPCAFISYHLIYVFPPYVSRDVPARANRYSFDMGLSYKKKYGQRPGSDSGSGASKSLESRSEIVPTPRRNLTLRLRKPLSPVSKPSTESPAKRDHLTTGGKTVFSFKNPLTPKASPSIRPAVEDELGLDLLPDDEMATFANKGPVSRGMKVKERVDSVSSETSEASNSESGHLTKPADLKRLGSIRDIQLRTRPA